MPNPPVPNERKRARGNPGKRALPKVTDVAILDPVSATPPAHLKDGGRDAWVAIKQVAPWIANSDGGMLLLLCEKIDRRDAMKAQLEMQSFTLLTDKGYVYSNPLVGMLGTIETDIVKIMSLLGLDPTDRTRLGLAEVKAQSTLEKMKARRSAQ